jgi:hypothetical protein
LSVLPFSAIDLLIPQPVEQELLSRILIPDRPIRAADPTECESYDPLRYGRRCFPGPSDCWRTRLGDSKPWQRFGLGSLMFVSRTPHK